MVDILGLIPARGGSKGVPGKNIRTLNGKPLIAWTIEAALQSKLLTRLIVSTDDEAIASVAIDFGAEAPFIRPSQFASDTSPDIEPYRHAVTWLRDNDQQQFDFLVWLRPTAPLRTATDIDSAITKIQKTDADCLRSVCPVEHHPYWMYITNGDFLRSFDPNIDVMRDYPTRQSLPPAYRLNGAVDISRPQQVLQTNHLYGGSMAAYVMPAERSVDIDTEFDFTIANILMEQTNDAQNHNS